MEIWIAKTMILKIFFHLIIYLLFSINRSFIMGMCFHHNQLSIEMEH